MVFGESTAYCNSCPRKTPQVGRGSPTRTTTGGGEKLEQEVTFQDMNSVLGALKSPDLNKSLSESYFQNLTHLDQHNDEYSR